MAQTYRKVHTYHKPDYDHDSMIAEDGNEAVVVDEKPLLTKAQMIVQYLTGIIVSLLTLRFILALFGANPGNGFVNFIYDVTAPLVAPFQGLFNITGRVAGARFEFETLFAGFIYILVGIGIVKLIDIFRR